MIVFMKLLMEYFVPVTHRTPVTLNGKHFSSFCYSFKIKALRAT